MSRSFGTSNKLLAPGSGMVDKDDLRRRFRAMREGLYKSQVETLSRQAQARILELRFWREAKTVLLYVGCRGETTTDLLLQSAWKGGKTVLLPRCLPDVPGGMELACVQSEQDLTPGLYAIPEPNPTTCRPVESPDVDIVVTPAVAFDRSGYRLGQGGGYYDRLLASESFAKTLAIGLAYHFQIVDSLPVDNWDRPVAAVASDKDLIWT